MPLFLLLWLCCSPFIYFYHPPAHAIYISTTEIAISPEGEVSISTRIFSDDFSDALRNYAEERAKLSAAHKLTDSNAAAMYLSDKLSLTINNHSLPLQLLSVEIDSEVTWCHLSARLPSGHKALVLRNQLLIELFPTQQNITKVTQANGKSVFFRFQNGHTEMSCPLE